MASAPTVAFPTPTLAVAESVTGGLLASSFVGEPGASAYFKGSITAYSLESKVDLLKVPSDLVICTNGVDKRIAEVMAQSVSESFGSDYGLATTGYAQVPAHAEFAVNPNPKALLRDLLIEESVYQAFKDDDRFHIWPSDEVAEPGMRRVRIPESELLALERSIDTFEDTSITMIALQLLRPYWEQRESDHVERPENITGRPYAFVAIYRARDGRSQISLIVGTETVTRNAFRAEIVDHARYIWTNRDTLLDWATWPESNSKD